MKKCTKCNIEKLEDNFNFSSKFMEIRKSSCRDCEKLYYEKNKQYIINKSKDYYKNNREKVLSNVKLYAEINDSKVKEKRKIYNKKNKYKQKSYNEQYYKKYKVKIIDNINKYVLFNKESIQKYQKEYKRKNRYKLNQKRNKRRQINLLFKLSLVLRGRLNQVLKMKLWKKNSHFNEYIGCTIEELKQHLERQFWPGMTWENHGKGNDKWNIDHIKPLSKAKTEEEMYKRCHYTNLQPLWELDNIKKGNKE